MKDGHLVATLGVGGMARRHAGRDREPVEGDHRRVRRPDRRFRTAVVQRAARQRAGQDLRTVGPARRSALQGHHHRATADASRGAGARAEGRPGGARYGRTLHQHAGDAARRRSRRRDGLQQHRIRHARHGRRSGNRQPLRTILPRRRAQADAGCRHHRPAAAGTRVERRLARVGDRLRAVHPGVRSGDIPGPRPAGAAMAGGAEQRGRLWARHLRPPDPARHRPEPQRPQCAARARRVVRRSSFPMAGPRSRCSPAIPAAALPTFASASKPPSRACERPLERPLETPLARARTVWW